MGSKKFGPNQNFLDMGQKAKLSKVNVSYHVPCALFHCFFSQISNEILFMYPILVGGFFHIFMGKTQMQNLTFYPL